MPYKKLPFFYQFDQMDCGSACLRMITKFYGKNYSAKTIREKCFITRDGSSLLGISDAAESLGLHTLGAKLSYEQLLNDATFPCIAHWKQMHYVVIYKVKTSNFFLRREDQIIIADPTIGIVKYKASEFKKSWLSSTQDGIKHGICLLLEPTPEFYKNPDEKLDKVTFEYLFSYLKPYKYLVFQLLVSFIVSSIFIFIAPFLAQSVVDRGVNLKDVSFLTIILIAQVFLTIGSASISFIRGWIMLHLTTRVNISLISNFIMNLMRLPVAFFDSKMTGDIIQRIGDNKRIQSFLTSSAISVIFSLINFIVFSIIIAVYNLKVFTVFSIGTIFYVLWIRYFLKYRRTLDYRKFAQQAINQSNIIQLVSAMQEIKLNNIEKQKRWEWEKIQASIFKIDVKGLMIEQYQSAGGLLINSLKNVLITYLVALSVINGEMTLGMMISVQYIIGQLNGPIQSLVSFIQSWQDAKISLERLSEIQNKDLENKEGAENLLKSDYNKDIKLKNVSFQYEGSRSPYVLRNLTLTIPFNKVTAIVGSSGSGKTTLLKLLMGFYPIENGEIIIGDSPLSNFHPTAWRDCLGVVLQESHIFSDTIANNIIMGDEFPDKAKLVNAVKSARILDFINSLPLGYNTKIGETGNGISQGQRQRILIARAMYKDPKLLLFDEATNALDANNELAIMTNLKVFFKEKTVVIVGHRLSTVKNADNIIVLEKGEIVEQGTHSELCDRKGFYYKLVKNQLELAR